MPASLTSLAVLIALSTLATPVAASIVVESVTLVGWSPKARLDPTWSVASPRV